MKRDMDLVRQLLLRVEEGQGPSMSELLTKPEDMELYGHHTRILIDAGFLTGIDASSMTSLDWLDLQLTWKGHEFLDTLRDPTIWDSVNACSVNHIIRFRSPKRRSYAGLYWRQCQIKSRK